MTNSKALRINSVRINTCRTPIGGYTVGHRLRPRRRRSLTPRRLMEEHGGHVLAQDALLWRRMWQLGAAGSFGAPVVYSP